MKRKRKQSNSRCQLNIRGGEATEMLWPHLTSHQNMIFRGMWKRESNLHLVGLISTSISMRVIHRPLLKSVTKACRTCLSSLECRNLSTTSYINSHMVIRSDAGPTAFGKRRKKKLKQQLLLKRCKEHKHWLQPRKQAHSKGVREL